MYPRLPNRKMIILEVLKVLVIQEIFITKTDYWISENNFSRPWVNVISSKKNRKFHLQVLISKFFL